MNSILAELWNGNVEPLQSFGRNNSDMKELERLILRHQAAVEQRLQGEAAASFQKYSACFNEYLGAASEQAFCDGFGLGVKIMAEIFGRSDLT